MPGRALEFRPTIFVLIAYPVAPAASVGMLWLGISIFEAIVGRYTIGEDLSVLPIILLGGSFVGIIAEFFFVTPFLLAFHRYRWAWINIWWFAGFGLAIGEVCKLLLDTAGPHHWFGWGAVLQGVSVSGFTGIMAAIVFYLIALRRAAPCDSAALSSSYEPAA